MTSHELASILYLKESYIRSHWPRVVESYKKQNVQLYKMGRGEDANYGIKFPWESDVCWSVDELEMM